MKSTSRNSSEEILKELKLIKQRSGDDVHSQNTNEEKNGRSSEEGDEHNEPIKIINVSHGTHSVKGKMGHGMEDFVVAENRKVSGHELGLYAIFDGHSGHKVAEYLQCHLFDNILNEPDFWTCPEKAVRRAYEVTDNEILERVAGSRGGSTAVTVILIDRKTLIVANVGDSRAVIYRGNRAEPISLDHEPTKEKELVESRGGFATQIPGNVSRVDGQLAMTRAFGDSRLKEHITSEPDIKVENIRDNTEFVILASDGLWNVMTNKEASCSIKEMKDAGEAAEELVREALSRNTRDDISCVVVMFH